MQLTQMLVLLLELLQLLQQQQQELQQQHQHLCQLHSNFIFISFWFSFSLISIVAFFSPRTVIVIEDAQNRARLAAMGFLDNRALEEEKVTPCFGPSPQFFNPPRQNFVLGWCYARRRFYYSITDPANYGGAI